jgi:hypothetical protein
LNNDQSLKYFKRKLPYLNKLSISYNRWYIIDNSRYNRHQQQRQQLEQRRIFNAISNNVLLDVFSYICGIPGTIHAQCAFKTDITDVQIQFMDNINYQIAVGIEYDSFYNLLDHLNLTFRKYTYRSSLIACIHDLIAMAEFRTNDNHKNNISTH